MTLALLGAPSGGGVVGLRAKSGLLGSDHHPASAAGSGNWWGLTGGGWNGSAYVYGSWTELLSSGASDVERLITEVWARANGTNAYTHHALRLGLGSAGAEIAHSETLFTMDGYNYSIRVPLAAPIRVPAGTRVSGALLNGNTSSIHIALNCIRLANVEAY